MSYPSANSPDQEMEVRSFFVRALFDFHSTDTSSLSFRKGALIEVLTQLESGWWDGLLDNDVRGWFPSNYVERISDDEAEMELQARGLLHDGVPGGLGAGRGGGGPSANYGLGIGSGFDSLRELVGGHGDLDPSDAFEQLAEAAMLGQNRSDPEGGRASSSEDALYAAQVESSGADINGALPFFPAARRSRASDRSVHTLGNGTGTTASSPNPLYSDTSSIPNRSAATSLTQNEYDSYGKPSSIGGQSQSSSLRPSEREIERMRTQSGQSSSSAPSQSRAPPVALNSGRNRAATHSAANTSPAPQSLPRERAASASGTMPLATPKQVQRRASATLTNKGSESEFWVPKFTDGGGIVYYNTRTGAQSLDLPEGMSAPQGATTDDEDAANSRANGRSRPKARNVRPGMTDRPSSTIYVDDGARASSAPPSRRNPIESMPAARSVPWPWKLRLADDERSFFFFNTQTRQSRMDLPPDALAANGSFEELRDHSGGSTGVQDITDDDSDIDGLLTGTQRTPGISPRMTEATHEMGANGQKAALASLGAAPPSMLRDEEDARALQQELGPHPPIPLNLLIREAGHHILTLIDIASEQGASPLPAGALPSQSTQTTPIGLSPAEAAENATRLRACTVHVIQSVRELMYASGLLSISMQDMTTLSELVSLVSDEGIPNGGVASFAAAIATLNGPSNEARVQNATVTSAALASIPAPPPGVQPLGRRIHASISKMALWARSAAEHMFVAPAPVEGAPAAASDASASLAQTQFERALYYRQRLREDAVDLANLVALLGLEAEKAQKSNVQASAALAAASASSHGAWVRRIEGALKSGDGIAGVGLEVLGGGSAAGWRGSGFVLPSAAEAAALRAEATGSYNNPFDLTRDAQATLSSGKIALRRKPMQPLSAGHVQSRIAPQKADLCRLLSELVHVIQTGGQMVEDEKSEGQDESEEAESDRNDARTETPTLTSSMANKSGAKSNGSVDGIARALTGPGCKILLSHTKFVLIRFGTFMMLVEDLDLASALDVDEPVVHHSDPAVAERVLGSVLRTKNTVQHFGSIKQGAYDVSSSLLVVAQEASLSVDSGVVDLDTSERVLQTATSLRDLVENLFAVVLELCDLSEAQNADSAGAFTSVGARAKVYGVAEAVRDQDDGEEAGRDRSASLSSVASKQLYDERRGGSGTAGPDGGDGGDDEDVMYLGPGIAVPNGPSAWQSSKMPSGGGRRQDGRPRSASVTTGGSSASAQSSTLDGLAKGIAGRRGTNTTGTSYDPTINDAKDDDDEVVDDAQRQAARAGRLKKFFGEGVEAATAGGAAGASASKEEVGGPRSAPVIEDHMLWFLEPDYAPSDIVVSSEGQVKGATLGALMERLTMHNSFDARFNNTFLLTYRSFSTTEEFLFLLFQRFRQGPPLGLTKEEHEVWVERKQKPIRLRVFNVLKSWLETYFYEGEDDEHLEDVRMFALDEVAQSPAMVLPSRQLLKLVERRQGEGEPMVRKMVMPISAPPPILPKNLRKIKFLDIDPLEMARQLTLLESRLYNRIKPVECLGKSWSRPDSDLLAKGIKDTINTSNRITGWVAEAILVQEDLKKRAAWIKQFVAIADRCRSLNNFSTMTAIVSGLNSAPVYRLRRTWDAVNQKNVGMLENLNRVMQSSKNFSDYREMIHKLNPPCVPFLGVYLTDLTFIEDGNPDRLKADQRLINFGKRQKTAEVIREIMIYQSTPYNLTPVPGIQKFIDDNLVESRGDNDLYQQSLLLEPREREDEKIARLLQESGFL